ncbi:MAG: hypothetical protein AM325_015620 [Candidatus Thorarchaeota archaeon SMTZ1-45]
MVESKEDLSAYIAYHSNLLNNLALISGFIFTAIVLLLTLLPNPSQPLVQLTFFLLLTTFNLVIFLLFGEEELLGYCVTVAPKLPEKYPTRAFNALSSFVWFLLELVVVIMFLVLELVYLALASAAMIAIMYFAGYFKIAKPMLRRVQWKRVSLHQDESTG